MDTCHRCIVVFDSDSNYAYHFGAEGGASCQLNCPHGIAVNLYVSDTHNYRVQLKSKLVVGNLLHCIFEYYRNAMQG